MIIQGDCIQELQKLNDNSVDCVVTSPPYNLTNLRGKIKPGKTHTTQRIDIDYDNHGDDMPEAEYRLWQLDMLSELHRIIKPTGSIFYNHKIRRWNGTLHHPWDFLRLAKPNLHQVITWDRGNSTNVRKEYCLPTTELIFWFKKDKPKVFKHNADYKSEVWRINPSRDKDHPASFPIELAKNCINLTTEIDDMVLDCFMGSGTTGLACKELNRQFIGIELSAQYCQLAKDRGVE